MSGRLSSQLVLHGAIVVLLGMVAGFPYGSAVTGGEDPRAWRMAHLEGVLNGLMMIAIGAARSRLVLKPALQRLLFWTLVITGYGNVMASILAAASGQRGLQPGGALANNLVFGGFMLAVVGVLVALILVVVGAMAGARSAD